MGIVDKFRDFFKKKAKHALDDPQIGEEARKRSAEIRQLNHDIRLAEHERELARARYNLKRLNDDRAAYDAEVAEERGEDKEDPLSAMLIMLLMKAFTGQMPPEMQGLMPAMLPSPPGRASNLPSVNIPTSPQQAETVIGPSFTDEQIEGFLKKIPRKYREMAKNVPEQDLKRAIDILKNNNI